MTPDPTPNPTRIAQHVTGHPLPTELAEQRLGFLAIALMVGVVIGLNFVLLRARASEHTTEVEDSHE